MSVGLLVAYGAQENVAASTVAEVLSGVSAGSTHQLSASAKTFASQFVKYFNTEILPLLDSLPADLDFLSVQDKRAKLEALAKTDLASRWLAHLLDTSTVHQVQSSLAEMVGQLAPELGHVLVKSPMAFDAEFKKSLRKTFKSDFVIFTTDKNLLGGLLTYRNGRLMDDSWLGKIKALATVRN